ncbi:MULTISPECIES: conjugal transfer protein TraN [Asticcacaulis]|uniref:conjugal transfer protein TraN n=1 Tax=Asticcacaulis TaxID=76890 RepID=UPI001AE3B640|nr:MULTISPECIES: conjugal transfer protein TraN [Asticcacaulis]MBP2159054.1 conjugal transfer mating pair stabilization protein TraN [Asticcacaulis solisilvae]MDR6800099.1 conjugal transfer mating pair stabilization protein TraN [Asticcacaulis sp. BE141]
MKRFVLITLAALIGVASLAVAQTPNMAEFQTALDRANAATVTSDIAGNLPGYQGDAAALQAKSGNSVGQLQSDGALAQAGSPVTPSINRANAYVAANPVTSNAAWVKNALGVANDPNGTAAGATGTTSTICRAAAGSTGQATLYSCESGNQISTSPQSCQTYQDIVQAPATKTCTTDSYFETMSYYADIGSYTEAHTCTLWAGPSGLNTGQGCGTLINQISAGVCAPPKLISGNQYLEYCKTPQKTFADVTYIGTRSNTCPAVAADAACSKTAETCNSWIDAASGVCGDKTVTYSCADAGYTDKGLNTLACTAYSGNPACSLTAQTCVQHASDVPAIMAALNLAPDTCLRSDLNYSCDAVTSAGSTCDVPAGCTLKAQTCIDPSYDGTSPCQTYSYDYSCPSSTAPANAGQAMCDASWVNGTAVITASDDPQNDLPQALSAINALKDASASYRTSGDLTIFGGEELKCGKSIGGLSNCCKDSGVLLDVNLTSCNADEQKLAAEQKSKACHYVGTYCSNKSFFGCLMKKMTYCCYGSALARIVEEAGHSQLGKSWGDAKSLQCGGFSVAEFQAIDLTNVDFSDFYAEKLGQLASNDPNSTVAAITASINAMNTNQTPAK